MSILKVDAIHSENGGSSNLELNDSRHVTVKGNLTVDGGLVVDQGNKNLIINGNHQISQRYTTKTGITGHAGTDRWMLYGDALTFDRVAITSASTGPWTEGHRYSCRIKNEAAGSDATATGQYIRYHFEAQDIATSGWDYIQSSSNMALSFWVKTSVAGTYYGSFWTSDGTAKAYNFSLGALSADTWTKITKIIPGHADLQFDNDSDVGLRFQLYTHRGTGTTASDAVMDSWHNIDYNKVAPDITHSFNTTVNATYEFTGVQLEVGDAVTSYEHRSYQDEWLRCARYFWMAADGADGTNLNNGVAVAWSSADVRVMYRHPVPMRVAPSLYEITGTDYWKFYLGGGTMQSDDVDSKKGNTQFTEVAFTDDISTTAGFGGWMRVVNAAGKLGLTAEFT